MRQARWSAALAALVLCIAALAVVPSACKSSGATGVVDDAHHRVGSPLDQPFPSEWQTGAWWVDPSNASGCASDLNTGTAATCTAGTNTGPLKTWQALNVQKWGCRGAPGGCPRLRQNTTITFLSSHVDNTDPVYFKPTIEAGAFVVLQGTLPTAVATGTTGTVTAKARGTPQLLASTFTLTAVDGGAAPTLVAGELIANSTHASRDWIYTVGSPNKLTTPMAAEIPGNPAQTPAEVTTWANSDAVAIYAPVAVNLVEVSPIFTDAQQTTFNNGLVVYQLNAFDPAAADLMTIGGTGFVQFLEDVINRGVVFAPAVGSGYVAPLFRNCYIAASLNIGITAGPQFSMGRVHAGAWLGGGSIASANLDADIILGATSQYILNGNLGTVYVETGKTLIVGGPVGSSSAYNTSTPVVWGPGTLNITGDGRLGYPAGAGKAASTLTVTTLQLNGQTKSCLAAPGSASAFATCNITFTAANADTNLGATSGCLTTATASLCNYGP